uniref:RAD52 motif-containing protein 1 n=1 Tax=Dicentrarchus labrax TaxID=13489 RepID=A0A8P4KPP7_DICLA
MKTSCDSTWRHRQDLGCSPGPGMFSRTWDVLQDLGCSPGPGMCSRTWSQCTHHELDVNQRVVAQLMVPFEPITAEDRSQGAAEDEEQPEHDEDDEDVDEDDDDDGEDGVMEVDILEFQVPVENNKTLFVWNIQPSHTEARIYDGLYGVFSSFGPLYLLKVCPNAALSPPGFYALIKFYSAAQASKAQRQTDGRSLLQSSPLQVRLSSKQTPHFLSDGRRPLSHARCLELANHCLGFNGWTSDIITAHSESTDTSSPPQLQPVRAPRPRQAGPLPRLQQPQTLLAIQRLIKLKELTNEEEEEEGEEEEEEEEEEGGGGRRRKRRLRFGCLLQLSFPRHGQTTRAAAVVEDSFTCTGPDVLLQKRCYLHRMVRERALAQAFSTVLLILLGNGKVMVEVKQTSDQFQPEETEGVLQVNEFAADEEDDDDEEWDLTVS